jgi:hypothetical protein
MHGHVAFEAKHFVEIPTLDKTETKQDIVPTQQVVVSQHVPCVLSSCCTNATNQCTYGSSVDLHTLDYLCSLRIKKSLASLFFSVNCSMVSFSGPQIRQFVEALEKGVYSNRYLYHKAMLRLTQPPVTLSPQDAAAVMLRAAYLEGHKRYPRCNKYAVMKVCCRALQQVSNNSRESPVFHSHLHHLPTGFLSPHVLRWFKKRSDHCHAPACFESITTFLSVFGHLLRLLGCSMRTERCV